MEKSIIDYISNPMERISNYYNRLPSRVCQMLFTGIYVSLFVLLILSITYIIQNLSDSNLNKEFNKIESLQFYTQKKNAEIFSIENDKLLRNIPHNNYTFGFWLYLDDWYSNSGYGKWKHIMHMGTAVEEDRSIIKDIKWNTLKNQNPGVWLLPNTNKLRVVILTENNKLEYSDISIDIKQWVNIVFVLQNRLLEIYKNGRLTKTTTLMNSPALNKDILYVNYNRGFSGYIKNIEIIPKGIGPNEAERIFQLGYSE